LIPAADCAFSSFLLESHQADAGMVPST